MMKWHVYKKDDPNTWPQIDCPMVVWTGRDMLLCTWYNDKRKMFVLFDCMDLDVYERLRYLTEFYYAYIGYVPTRYKTHMVTKCVNDGKCNIGCCDDGYCMYDFCECEFQREVNEYSIEEKRIWKEFE